MSKYLAKCQLDNIIDLINEARAVVDEDLDAERLHKIVAQLSVLGTVYLRDLFDSEEVDPQALAKAQRLFRSLHGDHATETEPYEVTQLRRVLEDL